MTEIDYNKRIYNFIVGQIRNLNRLTPNYNAEFLKEYGERHYSMPVFELEEWEYAYIYAVSDVFYGGCDIENI